MVTLLGTVFSTDEKAIEQADVKLMIDSRISYRRIRPIKVWETSFLGLC